MVYKQKLRSTTMKLLIILIALIGLTACGKPNHTTEYVTVTDTKALNELNDKINALNAALLLTQADLSTLESRIEALENAGMAVDEVIDPCGDQANTYDEVLLKLSSGQIVAFFEGSNNKRFLTVLVDGQYVTTDNQACRFDVVNGEVVLK